MNPEEHPLHRIQTVGETLSDQNLRDAHEAFQGVLQMLQEAMAGSNSSEASDSKRLAETAIGRVDEAITAVNGIKELIGQYLGKVGWAPSSGSSNTGTRPTASTEVREPAPRAEQSSNRPGPEEKASDGNTQEKTSEESSLTHGITPEMIEAIERGEWPEIPYDKHRSVKLEAGQIITNVSSLADFKAVERTVVAQVSPFARANITPDMILAGERSILDKSIEDGLRRAKFSGRVAGQAIILPFNPERAKELGLAKAYHEAADNNPGLTVIYAGELTSSGAGKIGAFTQEAFYLQKHSFANVSPTGLAKRAVQASGKGEVVRVLGKPQGLEGIKGTLKDARIGSAVRGRAMTAYAMTHAYSAGAHGQSIAKARASMRLRGE